MKAEERDELIDDLFDGLISEANFLRLEAELRVAPETRQAYYARARLNRSLAAEAGLLSGPQSTAKRVRTSQIRWLTGIAATIALLFVGAFAWQAGRARDGSPLVSDGPEPVATGFATLAEQSDAVWADSPPLRRGDLLPHGPLRLRSGLAQLELFSGVTVSIEGDCAFELRSPMEMSMERGKVRALVPDAAHGFKVTTATGAVVDLGTEFALEATEEHADMRVIQGEIEWHPNHDQQRNLVDGEFLRWGRAGKGGESIFDGESLPGWGDLAQRFSLQRIERRELWAERSVDWTTDPRVLAYYPMRSADDWQRLLVDESESGIDGTVVAARRVADRWEQPGGALNFSPTGSSVRVFVPGDFHSLTFYCWARIDSLDRMYNSLFLTDGHELNEPHWQIMNDGRLFFSVKRRDGGNDKKIAYSPSFWSPKESGKWFQIATAYDTQERSISHYVNGQLLSEEILSDEYYVETVKIGAASIGNWNEPMRSDPSFAVRNLNGAIDEFAIFAEALSGDEIAALYEIGRP